MQEHSNSPLESGKQAPVDSPDLLVKLPMRRKRIMISESLDKTPHKKVLTKDRKCEHTMDSKQSLKSPLKSKRRGLIPLDISFLNRDRRQFPKFSSYFRREQVKNSKRICSSCKNKLLMKKSDHILVESGMFSRPSARDSPSPLSSPCLVYQPLSKIDAYILEPKNLVAMRMLDINLQDHMKRSKLNELKNLHLLMIKFLLGESVELHEIGKLKPVEKKLFRFFVNKKKSKQKSVSEHTEQSTRNLHKDWLPKRYEENLRFILNKAFKFLRSTFNERLFYHLEKLMSRSHRHLPWKARFTYGFYGYYFQKTTMERELPLEAFFHPKAARFSQRTDKRVLPKTISQCYLNLLCSSPLFKRDLGVYVGHCLETEARQNIVFKVDRVCRLWEDMLMGKGEDRLLEHVEKQFRLNPKCKVPWGLLEVRRAVRDIRKIVVD